MTAQKKYFLRNAAIGLMKLFIRNLYYTYVLLLVKVVLYPQRILAFEDNISIMYN